MFKKIQKVWQDLKEKIKNGILSKEDAATAAQVHLFFNTIKQDIEGPITADEKRQLIEQAKTVAADMFHNSLALSLVDLLLTELEATIKD